MLKRIVVYRVLTTLKECIFYDVQFLGTRSAAEVRLEQNVNATHAQTSSRFHNRDLGL